MLGLVLHDSSRAASSLRSADPLTFDAIIAAVDANNALTSDALARSGCCLGIGIANLINLISPHLSAASSIDGATSWQHFGSVTLPLLSPGWRVTLDCLPARRTAALHRVRRR